MQETLYRFYDSDDTLLYVGISSNWQQRLKQHYKNSNFHDEAVVITLEHFETREQVESAEKQAILSENPKYNKAYNPDWENPQQHLIKIKFWVYSNLTPDEDHRGLVLELKSLFFEDELWVRKSMGPIAYYMQELLPEWSKKYQTKCAMCVDVYHSRQIESWAEQAKRSRNATN